MLDPASIPDELRTARHPLAARIEDAALTASQPGQQTFYDGWLLRHCPGKARRARSVNAIAEGSLPLAGKLAHCEAFYAKHTLPCIFRMTPFSAPAALDHALDDRGYAAGGDTRVMAFDLGKTPVLRESAIGMERIEAAEFGSMLACLHQLDPVKSAAERDRFARSAVPGIYIGIRDASGPIACGSAAIDGTLAGIFGMVTAAAHRGRGLAGDIVAALLDRARTAGAATAYLQVESANEPARRVYRRFGFVDCYAYWYRGRSGVQEFAS